MELKDSVGLTEIFYEIPKFYRESIKICYINV